MLITDFSNLNASAIYRCDCGNTGSRVVPQK